MQTVGVAAVGSVRRLQVALAWQQQPRLGQGQG